MDHYLQRTLPSLQHTESLVKMFVDEFKDWPSPLSLSKLVKSVAKASSADINYFKQIQKFTRSSLLSLLSNGLQKLGNSIYEWSILRDDVDEIDMSFQSLNDNSLIRRVDSETWRGTSSIVGSFELANSTWRLWGALGSAIRKVTDGIDITTEGEVSTVEEM
jgi:hypothetical protein